MPPPVRIPRLRRAAAVASLVLGLGSCAPHRAAPPAFEPGAIEARYRVELARRERRAAEAEVAVWAEWPEAGWLPGAEATLLLAPPDAFRLRVSSLFGTALDIGGRGDSLSAYLPPRRAGLRVDVTRDSVGLPAPGTLVYRAWSGAWRPPAAAWEAARVDSGLRLVWVEAGDTLELAVSGEGLPAAVILARTNGTRVHVLYRRWERIDGVRWPTRIELGDVAGRMRVSCEVRHVRFTRPDPARLVVRLPDEAQRVDWRALRRALERPGRF